MNNNSVLVSGATGYVGGRLIPELLASGYRVRCMVRNMNRIPANSWNTEVEFVRGDVLEKNSLDHVFENIDIAYYLIHSMRGSQNNLVATEATAAKNFGEQAKAQGVKRIIYLGGIESKSANLSSHLKSRIETGEALRASGVSVTEFRAGVIVGSGSLSFELIRYLTERVPVLITPKWVLTETQPISIRDVLAYLKAAITTPESEDQIIEIGGADVLTYAEMFAKYAKIRGLNRPIIKVPVLTPRLSSLWVGLVTPINTKIARYLIDGLDNKITVSDGKAKEMFDIDPVSYSVAVSRALRRFDADMVETYWSGSVSSGILENHVYSELDKSEGLIQERNILRVDATPDQAFSVISSLGGENRWLYANYLWRIRGFLDLLIGGIGMRRSRRSASNLKPGDTVDFWRVEKVQKPSYLLLRAEMKLPGSAWLEFSIAPAENKQCTITQTAYYEPKGLLGLWYWYLFSLPHKFIFPGMLRQIGKRASE
jgi:uncharacterized protein YbjT (DUF2867 family)